MKKTMISLVAMLMLIAPVYAQIMEGHASYTVDFSSKKPEYQMYAGMMQGSKMDIYFAPGKSRTEMKVGTMMETVSIVDDASQKMLTLLGGMMGKKAIENSTKKEAGAEDPKFKVELVNETKDIAGYKCRKAVVSDEEGNKYDFWYTEEIKMNAKGQKYFEGYGVPGFPMQMEVTQNGMDIRMVATAFEKSLPKKNNLFSLVIPEGYQVITAEELQKMTGGM